MQQGLTPVTHETYRGFVFARLADGPGFREYFGDSLSSIDNLADRSPEGELEIVGGCLRYLHNCNWKMFVENLNDTMHPMIVHASSAGTAKKLWEGKPADDAQADGDRADTRPSPTTTSSSTTWGCASTRTAMASPASISRSTLHIRPSRSTKIR